MPRSLCSSADLRESPDEGLRPRTTTCTGTPAAGQDPGSLTFFARRSRPTTVEPLAAAVE